MSSKILLLFSLIALLSCQNSQKPAPSSEPTPKEESEAAPVPIANKNSLEISPTTIRANLRRPVCAERPGAMATCADRPVVDRRKDIVREWPRRGNWDFER